MRSRTIPWLWLAIGFFWHVEAGFFLACALPWIQLWTGAEAIIGVRAWTLVLAGLIAFAWTGALPIAWTLALAWTRARPMTKTWVGAGIVALAGIVAVLLAKAGAIACAVAWALAWAWAGSRGGAWALLRILTWNALVAITASWLGCVLFGVVAWAGLGTELGTRLLGGFVVVAMAVTLPLGMGGVLAQVWAVVADELPLSLTQFHTFLILGGTSLSGIGLGWLSNRIIH